MGCAAGEKPYKESVQETVHGNGINYHVVAIQHHEGVARKLKEKIQKLDDRINQLRQKPSLDPKGFRVNGWIILKGTWQGKVHDLRERIAWHTMEVARLAGPTKNSEQLKDEKAKNS